MANKDCSCNHFNELIDETRGDIVCTDCGLVLSDKVFINYNKVEEEKIHNTGNEGEINELLERLNLPLCFSSAILKTYEKVILEKKTKKELLSYTIYKSLNDEGFPISLNEMSAVSGFTNKKLYSMQENNKAIILKPLQLLNKHCKTLGLQNDDIKCISVILPTSNLTGHNPLTVIGSTIYAYLKKHKPNQYSMKKIAKVVNTSCISIQRYLKQNELSLGV